MMHLCKSIIGFYIYILVKKNTPPYAMITNARFEIHVLQLVYM